jgi:hypothetical protein
MMKIFEMRSARMRLRGQKIAYEVGEELVVMMMMIYG